MLVVEEKKRNNRFQNGRFINGSFHHNRFQRLKNYRVGMKTIVLIDRFGIKTTNLVYLNEK